MNERRHDFELLQRFARHGEQSAFADVVRRHLDLVFATALRKLEDTGAAQEVAQNVFTALARKAWQFAPDDSLPAWLHKSALLESKSWLRGELRRRRREQTAAELGTTMKTPDEQPALRALVPLLDDALLSLREKDRTALLLRFYESQSLRNVGAALGVGEDAAQKRVAGALEQLANFFQRHGFKTATVAATAAALQQTATSASAATATLVVNAALQSAPPALAGLSLLLARLTSLTKVQTAALCVAIAAAPVAWQWNELRAAEIETARLQSGFDTARTQLERVQTEIEQLRAGSAQLNGALAEATQAQARNQEALRKLAGLKERLHGLLAASDYRWSGDLPFVRVPRWALSNVNSGIPAFNASGKLGDWITESLNLSPEQKQGIEQNLSQYLEDLDRLAGSRAYETNATASGSTSPLKGYITKSLVVPALGDDGEWIKNNLVTNVQRILGSSEQASLVLSPLSSHNQWVALERMGNEMIHSPQQFTLGVKGENTDNPTFYLGWDGHIGQGGTTFLPVTLPDFLRQRFDPWLLGLGITNDVFHLPSP